MTGFYHFSDTLVWVLIAIDAVLIPAVAVSMVRWWREYDWAGGKK